MQRYFTKRRFVSDAGYTADVTYGSCLADIVVNGNLVLVCKNSTLSTALEVITVLSHLPSLPRGLKWRLA